MSQAKIEKYVQQVVDNFLWMYPQVVDTLGKIPDFDRKILALHGYIKYMQYKDLDEHWAWTREEIESWEDSPASKVAKAAVNRVIEKFNALPECVSENYRLSGGSHPRELEEQIRLWNRNGSANSIGTKMKAAAEKELEKAEYPDPPSYEGIYRFFSLLANDWPSGKFGSPTNATPGLSAHGQMRAVDFHVKKDGVKILQSGGKAYWKSSGVAALLKTAIGQANDALGRKAFAGPLEVPDEPWHYTYNP